MSLNARAHQDAAIIGSGFLKLDGIFFIFYVTASYTSTIVIEWCRSANI